jgi:hypothetical protein
MIIKFRNYKQNQNITIGLDSIFNRFSKYVAPVAPTIVMLSNGHLGLKITNTFYLVL